MKKQQKQNPDSRFPSLDSPSRRGGQIPDSNSGQSLIETLAAIFLLTTALTVALGLTIYALSRSNLSQNEIVATNLAREGVDVVRLMRDTNWLEGAAKGGGYDLKLDCSDSNINGGEDFPCYPKTLEGVPGGGFHNYDLSNDSSYRLEFNPSNATWILMPNASYPLYLQANGTYTHTVNGSSVYARKITISHTSSGAFGSGNNAELVVTSVVGWTGKGCSVMTAGDPSMTNCKITLQEHMTNWKDYR